MVITRDAIKSWERVKEILAAALEIKGAERDRFLDVECEGDEKLRREIESLIIVEDETAGIFE